MWAGRSLNSSRVLLLLILFTTGCRKHFEPVDPVPYEPAPTDGEGRSRALVLRDPYPNPSAGAVTLRFTLARDSPLTATVHDLRGRRLRLLADIQAGKGEHRLVWRGRDDGGRRVPGGVYCVCLEVFDGTVHRTVTVLR